MTHVLMGSAQVASDAFKEGQWAAVLGITMNPYPPCKERLRTAYAHGLHQQLIYPKRYR